MRTTTRTLKQASTGRPTSQRNGLQPRTTTRTVQRPGARSQPRQQSRPAGRGLSPKQGRSRSPLFGILSLVCFALFWIFLLIAVNSLVVGAQAGDGKRMAASGMLGLFSFIWPFVGLALGIVGVIKKNSVTILGIIGLGFNGLLLLWVIIGMVSK